MIVNLLWNLVFRKILGPIDSVKTKLGAIILSVSGVVNEVLTIWPALVATPIWHTVTVIAAKVGSVLLGLGLIDKQVKIGEAITGK